MCSLIATANMIDKVVTFASVIFLCFHFVISAPASFDMNEKRSESTTSNSTNHTDVPTFSNDSNVVPIPAPELNSKDTQIEQNETKLEQSSNDRGQFGQLQATPANSKSTLKARKNKNDLFFCCTEDNPEPVTEPSRRSKDRERNTKPPILKRGKNPESEEPSFERRPALLLRFFPDGTAVLISKFQLHLHVKPKQIKLDPDDYSKPDDALEFNPGLILNDGKSYEVTYKRLEAIPSSKEQNIFDLDESEEREAYNEDVNYKDHEFITTSVTTTTGPKLMPIDSKPFPLQESTTTLPTTTEYVDIMPNISFGDDSKVNKSEKLSPTVGDSPFFIMTLEEMSSLQQQYDPSQASPLKATTIVPEKLKMTTITEQPTATQTTSTATNTIETTVTTELNTFHTEPTTTTTRCLSFRNQLSLALSTEDNIDNSLLKRHIFPTEDCNTSDTEMPNSFAQLQSTGTTPKAVPTTLPIITRAKSDPTTTQSYTRNNLVPYLASQFSNHPSKPDVVVVTSLPVLIDLKSTRNQPVTDVPAWREVTVGVVRDQQGQPLKPRYNNWTAHLRGLRKKTENKFWNDFTTPKPDSRPHSRQPIRQNFQQSPSQINRSFWTDLQRQREVPAQKNKEDVTVELYRTNPPRNYPAQNENEFQFWRNRVPNVDNRWIANANAHSLEYTRMRGPLRNPPHTYENPESRPNQQWNHGNQQQNNRRW